MIDKKLLINDKNNNKLIDNHYTIEKKNRKKSPNVVEQVLNSESYFRYLYPGIRDK